MRPLVLVLGDRAREESDYLPIGVERLKAGL